MKYKKVTFGPRNRLWTILFIGKFAVGFSQWDDLIILDGFFKVFCTEYSCTAYMSFFDRCVFNHIKRTCSNYWINRNNQQFFVILLFLSKMPQTRFVSIYILLWSSCERSIKNTPKQTIISQICRKFISRRHKNCYKIKLLDFPLFILISITIFFQLKKCPGMVAPHFCKIRFTGVVLNHIVSICYILKGHE